MKIGVRMGEGTARSAKAVSLVAGSSTRPGRPSKGPRDAILIRPSRELGALLRREGRRNRMTAGEWVVTLLAEQFELPHFRPEPSLRNPDRYCTRPNVTNGRDSILVRLPVEFGHLIKERARNAELNYGAYVLVMLELALDAQHKQRRCDACGAPIQGAGDLEK